MYIKPYFSACYCPTTGTVKRVKWGRFKPVIRE